LRRRKTDVSVPWFVVHSELEKFEALVIEEKEELGLCDSFGAAVYFVDLGCNFVLACHVQSLVTRPDVIREKEIRIDGEHVDRSRLQQQYFHVH